MEHAGHTKSSDSMRRAEAATTWLSEGFGPWGHEDDDRSGAMQQGGRAEDERREHGMQVLARCSGLDIMCSGNCKVIVRSRHASSAWERFVRSVVGDPVHLDVVLVKEGSAGGRFCFSSYMNQKFEMVMMDRLVPCRES
jgi:hypothetical protein